MELTGQWQANIVRRCPIPCIPLIGLERARECPVDTSVTQDGLSSMNNDMVSLQTPHFTFSVDTNTSVF
jgi:hypothetical protein